MTDSPRPSFKDMIVLHTSPSRPSIPTASLPVPKVKRGFKPKDAAEIAAREIMFENHDDPAIARKVQIEMNDFLQGVTSNAG